jgi:hypothetical protein
MEILSLVLLLTFIVLGAFAVTEIVAPGKMTEGFTNILPRTTYWSTFTSPRSDVGPDAEDTSYTRDPRYFNNYADVSRLGTPYDFCRVLTTLDEPDNKFFACALSGTDFLDSAKFRTPSEKDGFRFSLDDYMRDIDKDGRDDYCRILKWKDGSYQAVCSKATDLGFDGKEIVDSDPPEEIATLLRFYQECVLWYRFGNDMNDYVNNTKANITGKLFVDEMKKRDDTFDGLEFNGANQFIRISDSMDLSLGAVVPIRSIRAWMVWVYFDEFTRNAKIFDFGNGPGKDNVVLGILGTGDSDVDSSQLRPLLCGGDDTVPKEPSGAQAVKELPPQELMKTSDANVDEYTCTNFEVHPKRLSPSFVGSQAVDKKLTGKATLMYEVWDKQSRKMRMKLGSAIPLQRWTHICVTATSDDGFRPNIAFYINGKKVLEKESGWLPATSSMSNCYLGKSNWTNSFSQYEDKDELFKGKIFDFRAYRRNQSEAMVNESYDWGKEKLGVK